MAESRAVRKRKQRSVEGGSRERLQRGYARAEERNREAREALRPLAEGARPLVVTIGSIVSALIAASILLGYVIGIHADGSRPKLAQILAPALLMGIMAWGMWRARYWAVLGFQFILVVLILSAVFGLAANAASPGRVAATLALLAICGGFFYFMIKAMARIQMPQRLPRD